MNSELSDLFFNSQNEHYVGYIQYCQSANQDFTKVGVYEAVLNDASQFIANYPTVVKMFGGVTAEELASDFAERV